MMPAQVKPLELDDIMLPGDMGLQRHYVPMVVMLMAPRGRGKSVGTTAMGRFMLDAYRSKGLTTGVLANYNVKFAQYCSPFLVDELKSFPRWANNKLILLDEITEFMPSGRAMTRSSLDIASFIRQIRKRGVDIITNTQFPIEVDRRLLRQIDLFVEVQLHWRRSKQGPRADLELFVYDYWGHFTGNWRRSRQWPPAREDADNIMWMENVHTVFPMFDSLEIQAPIWSEAREEILTEQGWDIKYEEDDLPKPEPAAVINLAEYIERNTRDGTLNIGLTFDRARAFMPEWKSRRDYQKCLEGMGWRLQAVGTGPNNMIAFAP